MNTLPTAHDILQTLAQPVLCVDALAHIRHANLAAQSFFNISTSALTGKPLADVLPDDSPLLALISDARQAQSDYAAYAVDISFGHLQNHAVHNQVVDLLISPMADFPGWLVVQIQPRTIARMMSRQLSHQSAARSVVGVSALLAHEIKNPLSGIRGAAQLLEPGADVDGRELTRMICVEVDRIAALVDRMETFTDTRPTKRQPENIHEILSHVAHVAVAGFARDIKLAERYDPSLPLVDASRDALVQVFLNLVKNAAEAVEPTSGTITITTAYRHGVRLTSPGTDKSTSLPIEICIMDDGPGVADEIRDYMFDPFVTKKPNGSGLGLALVAKIIGDHSGVVEYTRDNHLSVMRILLPAVQGQSHGR